MSTLICKLNGVRGRSIDIYDNKCVITTDVTIGSLLTNNALDGEKTIFYIDIVGIQFKQSGFTIGYLQFETAANQMNNLSSNMFSENTFTYEEGVNGIYSSLMVKVRDYIADRIESYKYNTPANDEFLFDLVYALESANIKVNPSISERIKAEIEKEQERKRAEQALLEAETERKKAERAERLAEMVKAQYGDVDLATRLNQFILAVEDCSKAKEILDLWQQHSWEVTEQTAAIEKKISETAMVERMYGFRANRIPKLLEDLKALVDG